MLTTLTSKQCLNPENFKGFFLIKLTFDKMHARLDKNEERRRKTLRVVITLCTLSISLLSLYEQVHSDNDASEVDILGHFETIPNTFSPFSHAFSTINSRFSNFDKSVTDRPTDGHTIL